MADQAFAATYRESLSSERIAYMLEWMYVPEKLRGEMRSELARFIAEADGTPCGYLSVERL